MRPSYSFTATGNDATANSNSHNDALLECLRGETPHRPHATLEIVSRLLQQFTLATEACQKELNGAGIPPHVVAQARHGAGGHGGAPGPSNVRTSNPLSNFETVLVKSLVRHYLYNECRPAAKGIVGANASSNSNNKDKEGINHVALKLKEIFSPENISRTEVVEKAKVKIAALEKEKAEITTKLEAAQPVAVDGDSATAAAATTAEETEVKKETLSAAAPLSDEEKAKLNKRLDEINAEDQLPALIKTASAKVCMQPGDFGPAFARSLMSFVIAGNPLEAAAIVEQMFMNPEVTSVIFSATYSVMYNPMAILIELLHRRLVNDDPRSPSTATLAYVSPIEAYNLGVFIRILHKKIIIPLVAVPPIFLDRSRYPQMPKSAAEEKDDTKFLFEKLYPRDKVGLPEYPSEVISIIQGSVWHFLQQFQNHRTGFCDVLVRGEGFDNTNSYESGSLFLFRNLVAAVFRNIDTLTEVRKMVLAHTERSVLKMFEREFDPSTLDTRNDHAERIIFGERLTDANGNLFANLMNTSASTNSTCKRGSLDEFVNIRSMMYVAARPPSVIKSSVFQDSADVAKEVKDHWVSEFKHHESRKTKEEEDRKRRQNHHSRDEQRGDRGTTRGGDDGHHRRGRGGSKERSRGDRDDHHRGSRRDGDRDRDRDRDRGERRGSPKKDREKRIGEDAAVATTNNNNKDGGDAKRGNNNNNNQHDDSRRRRRSRSNPRDDNNNNNRDRHHRDNNNNNRDRHHRDDRHNNNNNREDRRDDRFNNNHRDDRRDDRRDNNRGGYRDDHRRDDRRDNHHRGGGDRYYRR